MAVNRYTISYLLLLRGRIVGRFLNELGFIRSVLLCTIFSIFLWQIISEVQSAFYLTALGLAVIFGIHFYRKDRHFIQSLGVELKLLFFIEYLFVSVPVLFFLVYLTAWLWLLLLVAGCVVASIIPVQDKRAIRSKSVSELPISLPYEWASGLRSQKWVLAILLIAGFTLSWLTLFAGWIFLFFITIAAVPFYKYCEPIQFIHLEANSSMMYISRKILQGIAYYSLLTSVLWVEILILYPSEMLYSLLFFATNLFLLATVIAAKYAFYNENRNIEMMISIVFWIGCICLLVPYLSPVILLLFIWLFVRGCKRLKWVVYAFH